MDRSKIVQWPKSHTLRNREEIELETADLPFIERDKGHIDFWSVGPSGDYKRDCQTGRAYGVLALKHMRKADFIPLFTWCVMSMPREEDFSGVEVGFLEFFAELAVCRKTSK